MARDPVCGMEVDEQRAPATMEYESQTYYFCSEDCKRTFAADPHRYIAGLSGGYGGSTGVGQEQG